MDCPYLPEISGAEVFGRMRPRILAEHIPINGSMELTWRCNLRCAHCYITAADSYPQVMRAGKELSTAEFCRILDEMADEGCLWLLFTGGEPFVRDDFFDVYVHAKRRGILPTLFTNGTLLSREIVQKLADWPPRRVEVTLYGRTQETYEWVTRVPGSFSRCMAGIDLLLEHGLPLQLKTMVMTLNRHELPAMEDFACSLGVDFRYDPTLNGCIDGSSAPLPYRLDPEDVVALDVRNEDRLQGLRRFFQDYVGMTRTQGTLFTCGAGLSSFHVDPFGRLSICMMVRNHFYDLRAGSFRDGWHGHARDVRFQAVGRESACHSCYLGLVCSQCPGWSYCESGEETAPIDYLCRVTYLRARALGIPVAAEWPFFCSAIKNGMSSPSQMEEKHNSSDV